MSKLAVTSAQALYDLGAGENLTGEMLEQMTALDRIFKEQPEYLRLLSAPNISKEERCDLLQRSVGGSIHPYVLNFLKILTERGYIRAFHDCCKEFSSLYTQISNFLFDVCCAHIKYFFIQGSSFK